MDIEKKRFFFCIERCILYHDRRTGFFDVLHTITSILTVSIAGAFVFQINNDIPNNNFINFVSWSAGIFAGLDVVLGFSKKAEQHRTLKKRFLDLKENIYKGNADEATWQQHLIHRNVIERDEPPPYRALDLLCHNATVASMDFHASELKKLAWYEKITAHFYRWSNIGSKYHC